MAVCLNCAAATSQGVPPHRHPACNNPPGIPCDCFEEICEGARITEEINADPAETARLRRAIAETSPGNTTPWEYDQ